MALIWYRDFQRHGGLNQILRRTVPITRLMCNHSFIAFRMVYYAHCKNNMKKVITYQDTNRIRVLNKKKDQNNGIQISELYML